MQVSCFICSNFLQFDKNSHLKTRITTFNQAVVTQDYMYIRLNSLVDMSW